MTLDPWTWKYPLEVVLADFAKLLSVSNESLQRLSVFVPLSARWQTLCACASPTAAGFRAPMSVRMFSLWSPHSVEMASFGPLLGHPELQPFQVGAAAL